MNSQPTTIMAASTHRFTITL